MKNRIIAIILFNLIIPKVFGQITDNELWTAGALKFEINKKFRAEIEQQVRLNDDISSFKNTFSELGLRYRINKLFSFKGNCRYIIKPNKNNWYRISGSFYFDLNKKKFPLKFEYRLKIQNEKEQNSGKKITKIRNKGTFDYNLSKPVDPYISGEIYYRLNKINEFRTIRITVGLDWKLSKNIDLTTFFRVQNEINVKNLKKENIIGLMIDYNL